VDKEGFAKKILEAAERLVTLEIVTVVGTYDSKTNQPGASSKMMRTRLNLLDGDKVTEVDPDFVTGPLTSLRGYHADTEKQGHDIIKANLETLEKMLGLLDKLPGSTSAAATSPVAVVK